MLVHNILIIDDHELFGAGLKLILKRRFPNTDCAVFDSVEVALQLAIAAPDLVLLDVNLKGMDGLSGAPVIKARWPGCAIIMVSSEMDAARISEAVQSGVHAYLSKADPPERILSVIENLFGTSTVPTGHTPLTQRQIDILIHVESGLSNKAIARLLTLSEFTVRGHMQALMRSLSVTSRTGAVFAARQRGLI
jgi:DNA-binding NarL/FixJ family response regulator